MSDSNPRALLERTSLIAYDADIVNCSRHYRGVGSQLTSRQLQTHPSSGQNALCCNHPESWRQADTTCAEWEDEAHNKTVVIPALDTPTLPLGTLRHPEAQLRDRLERAD